MPAGACQCRHSWCLFPVAVVLLVGGCVALLMLGLPTVQLYSSTRHFLSTECIVIDVQYLGNRSCAGGSEPPEAGVSSTSSQYYPCVVVTVYYDDDRRAVVLYKTVADVAADELPEVRDGVDNSSTATDAPTRPNPHRRQCSIHACSQPSTAENFADVQRFVHDASDRIVGAPSPVVDESPRDVNDDNNNVTSSSASSTKSSSAQTTPTPFQVGHGRQRCYVDRANRRAFVEVVTGDRAVHTLWWPSLAVGFGLFLMIVGVCQACYETQTCRRRGAGHSCRRRNRNTTSAADELPEIAYKKSASGGSFVPGSACSTCERATLSTTTTGTSSSRGSKSRSSDSNRSLLQTSMTSHNSTTRSTRSDVKKSPSRQNSLEQRVYDSNTV